MTPRRKNHAEPLWNYLKNSVLDPKRVKLGQKSEHGHVHHVPRAPSEGKILQKNSILVFNTLFNKVNISFYKFNKGRVFCWLNRLRNTRGNRYGKYSGNIYGIYKEYTRNNDKYLWYKVIRNTGTAFGGAPMGRPPRWVCVSDYSIS